jgi:hypothetical protein
MAVVINDVPLTPGPQDPELEQPPDWDTVPSAHPPNQESTHTDKPCAAMDTPKEAEDGTLDLPWPPSSRCHPHGNSLPWLGQAPDDLGCPPRPLGQQFRHPRKCRSHRPIPPIHRYAVDLEISAYYKTHMAQHKYLEIELVRHTSQAGRASNSGIPPNPIIHTLRFRANSHIPKGTIIIVPVGRIVNRGTPRCQHQYKWQPPDSDARILDASQVATDTALSGDRPNMCL